MPKYDVEKILENEFKNQAGRMKPGIRMFGPGSDIMFEDDRMLIEKLNGSHYFVFNKFPVFPPQFLLLTADSFRRQDQALEADDLAAAIETLRTLEKADKPFYAFYNCGKAAGQSRNHKHIQVSPATRELLPDDSAYNPNSVPFVHFLHRFTPNDVDGFKLHHTYSRLLNKAKECLKLPADAAHVPHNMVMTMRWIMVIPRRHAPDLTVWIPNAPGMLGFIFLPNFELVEEWKRVGPSNVYHQCGVPNDAQLTESSAS